MAPSAVSYGIPSVLVTAGLALLPIAVDGVTNLVLKHLPIVHGLPRVRWVFSSITTAAAVYRTLGVPQYNLSNMISGYLYLVYKVYGLISIKRKEGALAPHPSIEILRTKYVQLMDRMTIRHDGSKDVNTFAFEQRDIIRKKWKEPETVRFADELINLAAHEMKELHQELMLTAQRSGVPTHEFLKKMAEELTNRDGPYAKRFCSMYSTTLLDIYRAVRGLRFYVTTHGDKISIYEVVELEQNEADSAPFFTPGAFQADLQSGRSW